MNQLHPKNPASMNMNPFFSDFRNIEAKKSKSENQKNNKKQLANHRILKCYLFET